MNSLNLVPSNFSANIPNAEVANIVRNAILNGDVALPEGIDAETVSVKASRGSFIVTADAIASETGSED